MIALLGFDAVSVPVLERLLEEGRLPSLAALRAQGVWQRLESVATHFAAGAFYTMYSGIGVGEHGLYYPFQWSAGEQRVRPAYTFPQPEAVWERLSRAGGRCLIVDPYESAQPRAVNGLWVSGWQFANRVVLPRDFAPSGERPALESRFGRSPAIEETFGRPRTGSLLALRQRLVDGPARAAALVTDLLPRGQFDLVWIGFAPAHLAGHQFWDLSQLAREPSAGKRAALWVALADVYEAVDTAIGQIVEALPAGADVIVLSPVGMSANTSRSDLLAEMLQAVLDRGSLGRAGGPGLWGVRAAVPMELRGAVAGLLPDRLMLELTSRLECRGIDWGRTRAFAVPADHQGFVRVNLRGRERDGIVDPGAVDALLEEIAEGLMTFSDPDGLPSVAGVDRVAEIERGARLGQLPDLVVRWSARPATRLRYVSSPRFGKVLRRGVGSGRSGNHVDDAWVLLVPGRSRLRTPKRPPRLVDAAATVAALLGADTGGLHGEPLLGA